MQCKRVFLSLSLSPSKGEVMFPGALCVLLGSEGWVCSILLLEWWEMWKYSHLSVNVSMQLGRALRKLNRWSIIHTHSYTLSDTHTHTHTDVNSIFTQRISKNTPTHTHLLFCPVRDFPPASVVLCRQNVSKTWHAVTLHTQKLGLKSTFDGF